MRHRGSLHTTSALLLFAFYLHTSANTHHRLKRQTLPSDHIQVHSFNSNVSIRSSTVSVLSDESRIDLTERFLSGQVWSQNSLLEFEPRGSSENIFATNAARAIFNVRGANLSMKADRIEVLLLSNHTEDGHSLLEMVAESDIDMVLLVKETHVEAAHARLAHVTMLTWQLSLESRLTLTSNISTALNRQLFITSTTNNYNLIITLDGAKVNVHYRKVSVEIADDYRSVQLISASHTVRLQTVLSPFDIFISEHEMWIRCGNDNTAIHTIFNSTNVYVDVEQLAKTLIERQEAELRIGDNTLESAEHIQLTSVQLAMVLASGRISSMHAFANKSQIVVQTNATKMTSTASHHTVNLSGGTAALRIFTGNVSITITTNIGEIASPTSLSLLTPPTDNFTSMGSPSISFERNVSHRMDIEQIDDVYADTSAAASSIFVRSESQSPESATSLSVETAHSLVDATELSREWIVPNEQPINRVRITTDSGMNTVSSTQRNIATVRQTDSEHRASNEVRFSEENIVPSGTENSIELITTFIIPSDELPIFSEANKGVSEQEIVYSTQESVLNEMGAVDKSGESGRIESGAEQAAYRPTLNTTVASFAVASNEQMPSEVAVAREKPRYTSEVNSVPVSQRTENLGGVSVTSIKELSTNSESILLSREAIHSVFSKEKFTEDEQQQTVAKSNGKQSSGLNEHPDIREGEAVMTNSGNASEESGGAENDTVRSLEAVTAAINEAFMRSMVPKALETSTAAEPCIMPPGLTLDKDGKEYVSGSTTQPPDGSSDYLADDSLEILATITNIVVDPTLLPSDVTTLPNISHSSVSPNSNSFQESSRFEGDGRSVQLALQHRRRPVDRSVGVKAAEKSGDDRIVRDLSVNNDRILELHLRVPRSVDSDGTEFRSGISFALNGIIEELLEKQGKSSTLNRNESSVKITGTRREDDEVSVHFVVYENAKVGNLSDSLNEIVFSSATTSMPYPIIGDIRYLTKRSSNTTLFISAPLAVLLLLSMLAFCRKVFQEFGYIERIAIYLRRGRVVDLSMLDKHNSFSLCA